MTRLERRDLREPQRQSLWAVVFLALRILRQVGIVQVLIGLGFLIARTPSIAVFFIIVAVIGLVLFAGAALQWWRYTFAVIGEEVVVTRGVFAQHRLTIPLDRVQSVSLEQKLLHRIISLVQVSLDTAGTDTAEFTIDAVDQRVAEALQRISADHRRESAPAEGDDPAALMPPPPEQRLLKHTPERILKIALTQMPFAGLVLVAPLFAIADDVKDFIPFDLPEINESTGTDWLVWAIPLAIVVGLVFSVLSNIVRVFLIDWDLTLTSTGAGLRRTAGMLSTTSVAASIPRIQMLRIRQGFLERLGSLHSVDLSTVGQARLAIPGCDIQQVAEVRHVVLGDSAGVGRLDRVVSGTVVFLQTRNALIVSTVACVGLYFAIGWWALLAFVRVPFVWLAAKRRARLRRWGLGADAIADRRELLGWRHDELLLRKVNGVVVRQGIFERKRGLATLQLATASGDIVIGMIPLTEAKNVRDQVLHAVETDTRPWW